MAKINIQNGIISSSADYSLYHGTTKVADIEQNAIRIEGDLIAENYIVSSSVTYMTQSFSSGSTIFGNSADDTHVFVGNTISGSSTSTGSFQRLRTTKIHPLDGTNLYVVGPSGASLYLQDEGSTNGHIKYNDAGRMEIGGDSGLNDGIYFRMYGNGGSGNAYADNVVFHHDGNVLFNKENAKISGSATSTGSFGRVHVADKLAVGTTTVPSGVTAQIQSADDTKLRVATSNASFYAELKASVSNDTPLQIIGRAGDVMMKQRTADTEIEFLTNNTTRMYLDSTGLGIGTTSPATNLHITGSTGILLRLDQAATAHGQNPMIEMKSGMGGGVYGDSFIRFVDTGEGKSWAVGMDDDIDGFSITYAANTSAAPTATPALYIGEDSQVGIGTTSPTETLHVEGSASFGGNYIINEQGRQDHVANTMPAPYYRFDGVDDYIDIDDTGLQSTIDSETFSLGLWVYPTGNDNALFSCAGTNFCLHFNSSEVLQLQIDGTTRATTTETLPQENWTYVCLTVDSSGNDIIYFNGVKTSVDISHHTAWASATFTSQLAIGARSNGMVNWDGHISSVTIFNTALTATEVKELYSGASVPFKYKGANQTALQVALPASHDFTSSNTANWFLFGSPTTASTDGSGVLTITADAEDEGIYTGSKSLTKGKRYRVDFDMTISNNDGSERVELYMAFDKLAIITDSDFSSNRWNTDGHHYFEWTASESDVTGPIYIRSDGYSDGFTYTIANFTFTQIGAVAEYDGTGATGTKWYDKSGNNLDGTVTGATLENKASSIEFTGNISGSSTSTGSFGAGYIDNKLGIGTTTPSYKLDVGGDSDTNARVGRTVIGYGAYSDYAWFSHTDRVSAANYALIQHTNGATYLNSSTGTPIYFRINNVDKMILASTGKVGIGTTSPDTLLEVGNNASNTDNGIRVSANGTGNPYIQFANSDSATNSVPKAMIIQDTSNSWYRGDLLFCLDNTGDASVVTTADEVMRLTTTGNATFSGKITTHGITESSSYPYTKSFVNGADAGNTYLQAGSTSGYETKIHLGGRSHGTAGIQFQTRGVNRLTIDDSTGNATFAGTINSGAITSTAGISGTTGTFSGKVTAASKSFLINHPTKKGKKLEHGSLEGPENGVYVRGKVEKNNVIELPEYWTGLVNEDTITVQLTPMGSFQKLYVKEIKDNKVYVEKSGFGKPSFFYNVYGERKDIEKMKVEH